MNKSVANMIRNKLSDSPFVELFGGLVYTQVKSERIFANEDDVIGREVEYKFPVAYDYIGLVP